MKTVQGDADTFLVWRGKTNPTTFVTLQHGDGKSGGLDEEWSFSPPRPYVEVGKELVFVTDLVLFPTGVDGVGYDSLFSFAVGAGASTRPILLNWGDTLVSRQNTIYGNHLKYSRLVITAVEVCTPEFFYDLGGGDRPADPTWGVTPGGPSSWFLTHIRIGVVRRDLTEENPVYDIPDPMWTYGDPALGTQLSPMVGMARGLVQPTSVALPQVVGRIQADTDYETYGNLVCLTMVSKNGADVDVPSDPAWRLRVVLRGYVA